MKKLLLFSTAIFFAFSLKSQDITGTWNGTLSVQGHNIRVVFNITKDGETYKATMDSPDQGARGIAVNSVTFEDGKITMRIAAAQAEYVGELNDNTITGSFRQMGMNLPLNLTRAGSEQSGGTNGFIRGRLFDSQTREALMFSSIALIRDEDSSLVTGVITDENGLFLLENLRDGKYRLRITNVGYHPYISHAIELRRGNNRLDLGTFFINPSTTQLMEVEIVATRPILEQQAGRLVFNVAQSTTSVGDNALETLKKFPGVTVDNDDNISLNGNSSVMVMIDGRPTRMSGAQLANLLKSMSSEDIDRIEAIDNPPARFDAEGIAGILNIRTKRNRMMGYSGTAFAGTRFMPINHSDFDLADRFQHNAGFDINFRNNKFTVFANFNVSTQNNPAGVLGSTKFPNGSEWIINGNRDGEIKAERWGVKNFGHSFSGRGGFDYHINPKNILSLSYRISEGEFRNKGNMNTRMFAPSATEPFTSFRQTFDATNSRSNQNLNLNYQHIFDEELNRQMFVDASWVRNVHTGKGGNNVLYYWGNFVGDTIRTDPYDLDVYLPSDIFSVKADLEFPFTKETKLETGVQHSFVRNDNTQEFFSRGVPNLDMTNRYIYTENITAFYAMLNHTFSPNTSVEVGLRGEYTSWKGDNRTMNRRDSNNYFRVFPSLNANQKLTEKTGLNFSYSYRLRRPRYTDLNPFMTRNTAYEYNEGNPNLNPQYSHVFRLAYTYNHAPIVRVSYARSDGDIRRLPHFRGDTIFNRPENVTNPGINHAFGFQLMYQHTFFEKWRLLVMPNGEFSTTRFEYNGETVERSSRGFGYFISNDITLSRTMSLDVNSWGRFPQTMLFTKHAGIYAVNVGFRKSFFDRKLTATVSINDVFNTGGRWVNDTELPTGQISYQEFYWPSRSISARVSYRFGKGNVQTRRMRDAAREAAERLGGGEGQGQQGGGMGQ